MFKKGLFLLYLLPGILVFGQDCPTISTPRNGDSDVPVDTEIRWTAVDDIIGYVVSLGSTPGGEDILNRRSSGQNNFYVPEVGLPENTTIYVTIRLFIFGQPVKVCPVEFFTTEDVTTPPACTTLSRPSDGETGVAFNTPIRWNYAPTATGYRISMGTSSGQDDIVSRLDVGNVLSYRPTFNLPLDTEVFVTIEPYNENGSSPPCTSESFFIGEDIDFCAPFFDASQGGLIKRRPELTFPDQVAVCRGDPSPIFFTDDRADGFRWFQINGDGSETLLSEQTSVRLTEVGQYRYEAYNNIPTTGGTVECADSKIFSVFLSEVPQIGSIDVVGPSDNREVTVEAIGGGDYEYALNDPSGPYQTGNTFLNVPGQRQTVYVRDRNGCGIAEGLVPRELSVDDFPKFFTPNGDGINDFWQFIAPEEENEIVVERIWIFDRYGSLLAQIDPSSQGWDGNYQGKALPTSDYWFKAESPGNQSIRGHFTLKR